MRVDLRGRVALVTGAARGIGRSIADRLAENGASVIYADRDETGAAAASGGDHASMRLDVTDRAEIEAVMAAILSRSGRLDILVNGAGSGSELEDAAVTQVSPEIWDGVLRTDLTGAFLVARAAAAPMIAQGAGRIINIASVAGVVPLRRQGAYAAAKAAVVSLTRSMALELAGYGVLVNALAPGAIEIEAGQVVGTRLLSHVPLRRPARPREIANAALFLAAPASSYVTGHVLTVDGGWTAGYSRDF